jgi:hypothetical protein
MALVTTRLIETNNNKKVFIVLNFRCVESAL